MVKSLGEIIFTDLPELFTTIVDTFAEVISWFTVSIKELFDEVVSSLNVSQWLVDIVEDLIEKNKFFSSIYNVPLIALMLGSALGFYLVYQLIVWVLNLVT